MERCNQQKNKREKRRAGVRERTRASSRDPSKQEGDAVVLVNWHRLPANRA
jgi:hypothetical protein